MIIGHTLHGKGAEPVLVLHGWFADYTVFEPMLPWLDTGRFTYAFVDYRGYGKSRAIVGHYTIEELAQDAVALADHLGWRRFHAVGHSMGGKVLACILADTKGRVKSGVALTPVPASGVPLPPDQMALFESATDNDGARRGIIDFERQPVVGRVARLDGQALARDDDQARLRRLFQGMVPRRLR